ncbi:unnamed protein product [Rangifer tarandus platyrhynchus]|uniref:Uncharacterized protein n=1 Tax=Rangifer tarandus platyrhynchus TaxID=3082113 RepID=A0AC59Y705_RANTA
MVVPIQASSGDLGYGTYDLVYLANVSSTYIFLLFFFFKVKTSIHKCSRMFCLHEWVTLCTPFWTPLGCTTGSLAIFTVLWDLFQYSSHLGSHIKLNSVFLSISYVFCLFNGSLFA